MANEPMKIDVGPRKAPVMSVDLGGDIYEFKVPKLYGLMSAVKDLSSIGSEGGLDEAAAFARIEEWLFSALSDDDAARLIARFEDPEDSLDVPHMMELFQELVKKASDRPSG